MPVQTPGPSSSRYSVTASCSAAAAGAQAPELGSAGGLSSASGSQGLASRQSATDTPQSVSAVLITKARRRCRCPHCRLTRVQHRGLGCRWYCCVAGHLRWAPTASLAGGPGLRCLVLALCHTLQANTAGSALRWPAVPPPVHGPTPGRAWRAACWRWRRGGSPAPPGARKRR